VVGVVHAVLSRKEFIPQHTQEMKEYTVVASLVDLVDHQHDFFVFTHPRDMTAQLTKAGNGGIRPLLDVFCTDKRKTKRVGSQFDEC